jgi:hypothetical protein
MQLYALNNIEYILLGAHCTGVHQASTSDHLQSRRNNHDFSNKILMTPYRVIVWPHARSYLISGAYVLWSLSITLSARASYCTCYHTSSYSNILFGTKTKRYRYRRCSRLCGPYLPVRRHYWPVTLNWQFLVAPSFLSPLV